MLPDKTWLKFSLTISWNVDFHIADTGMHCLLGEAVTAVFGLLVAVIVPCIAQFFI
jgi:hypothetical protein